MTDRSAGGPAQGKKYGWIVLATLFFAADYIWGLWYFGGLYREDRLLSVSRVTAETLPATLLQSVCVHLPELLAAGIALVLLGRSGFVREMGLSLRCGKKKLVSGTIIGIIPAALRAVLKSVTKYTDNTGNASGSTAANVTATTDYFFCLSEYEVFGSITYGNTYEANKQAQYDYYKAGNSKIKYKHDATTTAAYPARQAVRVRSRGGESPLAIKEYHKIGSMSNCYGCGYLCFVRSKRNSIGNFHRYQH